MNNRKAFREWLEKEKNLSSRPCKLHIMRLESFEKDFQIFEMQKAEELDTLGQSSESLSLYREFLSVLCKLENHKTTEETEEISHSHEIAEKNDAPAEQDYPLKKKSIDYIIEQNDLFETAISNILSPIVDNENKPIRDTESVFDITTSRLLDVANNSFSEPMQKYVFFELKNRMQRADVSDNGFYYSDPEGLIRLGSCANAFYEEANENQTIIGDSLEDSQNKYIQSQIRKPICLVPDNLGDFGDTIKRQLKGIKNRVIQIPRSIAAVYQLMESEPDITESSKILCLDYNTNHLCRTEVSIGSDDSGTLNIIRMGRRQLSDRIAFDELANQYIDEYCCKNDIEISQLDRENLILSRDIIDIIKDHKSVIINTKFGYKSIAYDSQIASRLSQMIQEDISRESGKYDYVVGLSDFVPNNNSVFDFEGLQSGLRRICQKIDNKETIWVEYLPKLDLETVRNGKFEWISLISDNMSQEISELSMSNGDGVIIDIPDNKAFFPAGQDIIYLPLKRDSLGETGIKDKLAKFDDKKILPLKESIHVELKLSYHYGDPDSYKLFATAIDNPEISLASSWCNEDEQIMGNDKVPDYSSPIIKNNADEYDICNSINKAMKKFEYRYSYNGSPFESVTGFHNWNALWDVGQVRTSIPIVFSPENIRRIAEQDRSVIDTVEEYVERLVEIFYAANNRTINWVECSFGSEQYDYLMTNMAEQLSMLGGFVESDVFENKYLAQEMVNCVFNSPNRNNFATMYVMQLSTHITRANDSYGVWQKIDELAPKSMDVVKRSIGSICWRDENWIYEFGKLEEKTLSKVTKKIIAECKYSLAKLSVSDNPRWLRDELETLLSLTRLKNTVPIMKEILDCNSSEIKELVALLKEFNNTIFELSGQFKHPFVGRVQLNIPKEFANVHSVLYPLIEILSDGNAIKLTGYDSDEGGTDYTNDKIDRTEPQEQSSQKEESNKNVVPVKKDPLTKSVELKTAKNSDLDYVISQATMFINTSQKGLKEMIKYLMGYTDLFDGSECKNISSRQATELWPKGHYVIIPKLGITLKGITGNNLRQNEQLIEELQRIRNSKVSTKPNPVVNVLAEFEDKKTEKVQPTQSKADNENSSKIPQVDESEIDEVKISKKAAKLTAGLDIEGMNNEKLKSNAKFLKVYTDLIDLMQQYNPSIAKQLIAYGDDYMNGLSYLRKFYK